MATKKIGIYGELISTANNKVEDLFVIVEEFAIHLLVKNSTRDGFVAFESFEMQGSNDTYQTLIAFVQSNSNLILSYYRRIKFVNNLSPVVLSKKVASNDPSIYNAEIQLLFGNVIDQEVVSNSINDNTEIIYTIPNALQTLLTTMFPSGKWVHYVQYFIENNNNAGVYVQVFEKVALCIIRDENNILLVKYIPSNNPSDIIYAIMQSTEQLDLKLYNLQVNITGLPENSISILRDFEKYTSSIQFISNTDEIVGSNLNKEDRQQFYRSYLIF